MEKSSTSFVQAARVAATKAVNDREVTGEKLADIRGMVGEKLASIRSNVRKKLSNASDDFVVKVLTAHAYRAYKAKLAEHAGFTPQQVRVTAGEILVSMRSPKRQGILAQTAHDATVIEDYLDKLLPECWSVEKDIAGDEVAWVFTHLAD